MSTSQAIRRFWDIFESHRHFILHGPDYDKELFLAAMNYLRIALHTCSADLDLDIRHGEKPFFMVRNHGTPKSDALAREIVDTAPPLEGWQLCWERSWLPEVDLAWPGLVVSEPTWSDGIRVRLQAVRTVGGPPGFHLWFFLPPSAIPEKEGILNMIPPLVGDPGLKLIQLIHFEPLGERLPAHTYPFHPIPEWARWINAGILHYWEKTLVGLDEPGLTAPFVPF